MIPVNPAQQEEVQLAFARIVAAKKALDDADAHMASLMKVLGMDTTKVYNYDANLQAYIEQSEPEVVSEVASS